MYYALFYLIKFRTINFIGSEIHILKKSSVIRYYELALMNYVMLPKITNAGKQKKKSL